MLGLCWSVIELSVPIQVCYDALKNNRSAQAGKQTLAGPIVSMYQSVRDNRDKLSILGAGAVGHLLAACSARVDVGTELLMKPGKLEIPETKPLKVSGEECFEQLLCYDSVETESTIQHLVITLKSTMIKTAFEQVKHRLTDSSCVLILTNGLGHKEQIESILMSSDCFPSLLLGTVTHGAVYDASSNQLKWLGKGEIVIEENRETEQSSQWFFEVFEQAKLNPRRSTNISEELLLKLAVNSVINPLTMLHQCTNGSLLEAAKFQAMIHQLISECSMLFKRMGYNISRDTIEQRVLQVARHTANNHSSMLVDREHRRPGEIDSITGYLLKKAEDYGLSLPSHLELYTQVKQVESEY